MGNTARDQGMRLIVNPKARLLDQVREVMRFHHYALRTEKAYTEWIKRFLLFHRKPDHSGPERGWRHPRTMGTAEVAAFLTHLAVITADGISKSKCFVARRHLPGFLLSGDSCRSRVVPLFCLFPVALKRGALLGVDSDFC